MAPVSPSAFQPAEKGKVAIVTGASKGIGAAIARQLAKAGAAVVVNYASSKAAADLVVANILHDGGKAAAIQADMSKSGDIKRLFAQTLSTFGRPSILVNNAGIYRFAPLEGATEAEFHSQFDTNVLSVLLTTREAAAAFDGYGGSVINVSSISSVCCLFRLESGCGHDHNSARSRARWSQNSSKCDRAGHDRDRRPRGGGDRW